MQQTTLQPCSNENWQAQPAKEAFDDRVAGEQTVIHHRLTVFSLLLYTFAFIGFVVILLLSILVGVAGP